MIHLSPDELKAWYEHGRAADRERVMGHLGECDACRGALAALAVADVADVSAPAVSVADVLPRGYAARKAPAAARWAWLRPAYALAGAAVVVAAVLWVTSPRVGVGDDAVRSSELATLAPAGATSGLEFRWNSPFEAARYRVTVRDAAGTLVFSAETTEPSLAIDAATRGKFATMVEYSWTVSALDRSGEVIAESKPRIFLYQP